MNISAKAEYACVAVLDLAQHAAPQTSVRVRDIAARHGAPEEYLAQILNQLGKAGLVRGSRGAGGGFRLAAEPGQVTLGQVIAAIDGPPRARAAVQLADSPAVRALRDAWSELAEREQRLRETITIADLLARLPGPDAHMYYI